jgi:hypothetical protein
VKTGERKEGRRRAGGEEGGKRERERERGSQHHII